ncbi:hypothetical protein A2U01_0089484, partial [Trifolium medium]|nr:hypothetical protein [Trifolium medium]
MLQATHQQQHSAVDSNTGQIKPADDINNTDNI